MQFNADIGAGLPWRFRPMQRSLTVPVGEERLAFYEAVNRSDQTVVGRAVYNVTPFKVGPYFAKVHCFCFEEQTLQPGERVEMPVSFYVDPAMVTDADTSEVRQITLSYTFFIDRGGDGQAARGRPRLDQLSGRARSGEARSMASTAATHDDHAHAGHGHGKPNHPYHLVDPSPWPLVGSMSALLLTSGGVMWMHGVGIGRWVTLLGFLGVLYTMSRWWRDVLKESAGGDHSDVVVEGPAPRAWRCSSPPRCSSSSPSSGRSSGARSTRR